jgi:hypothetical protein
MLNETINLLKLTKSAIIYLINFVNIEENKKRSNGLIAPIVCRYITIFIEIQIRKEFAAKEQNL